MACLAVRRSLFDWPGPGCHRFILRLQYGDLWGYRGMTHSLLFACLLSAAFVTMWYRWRAREAQVGIFVYLFLCTASHSVLDALTDGGSSRILCAYRLNMPLGHGYPRYRPYRKATNCFAPRILFFTFSSATPACRSCCSNRIKASFNSLLNSLSITRSSTLGIFSSPD